MYYNLEKTAEILELQPGDVNRLREQGKLRAFRDGANWKFRKEDVEKYLTDLIRERSKGSSAGVLNDSDEELPTILADSASFDSMIDATADAFVTSNQAPADQGSESEDDFALDDDLALVPEEDAGDGLALVSEESADDGLALASEAESVDVLDDAGADDALHLGSDSGLSLLDGEEDDFALGGSAKAQEEDDSLFELSSESAEEEPGGVFELAKEEEPGGVFELAKEEEPGGVFELAKDPEPAAVLELEKADVDAATVLNDATDEGFQLGGATTGDSVSESGSQAIPLEGESDLFTTDDGSSSGGESDFFTTESSSGSVGTESGLGLIDDASSSEVDPFGVGSSSSSESSDGSFVGGFEPVPDGGAFVAPTSEGGEVPIAVGTSAPETQYTGKDFAFLVPCFIFLLLATIGAYELTRTIWSYESASFDVCGPLLDMLAKMVKLVG